MEDAVSRIEDETRELSYRLQVVEHELEKLTSVFDIIDEIKELKELVNMIIERMRLDLNPPPVEGDEMC